MKPVNEEEVLSIQINYDFTFNIVSICFSIIAWGVLGALAYKLYKKQIMKPKVWKVLLVLFIGLFSFSIHWNALDTLLKLPILPLGVWILYFMLKGRNDSWQRHRVFAWLGFAANFIFLVSTLLTLLVHNLLYDKDDPTSFISRVEHAAIVHMHPSAGAVERTLDKESLAKQLHTMNEEQIDSDQWYQDTVMYSDPSIKHERFPYLLIGASPKWGSGLRAVIYVEDDGKGILLTTAHQQLYFRFEQSVLKEAGQ